MKQQTASKAMTTVGIFAAIGASLCCITPMLALLAGVNGAASSLSWLEPARPYLIGLAIIALAVAWNKSLSNKESDTCNVDGDCVVEKKSFLNSKRFLIIITIAAVALITFPYYGHKLYQKQPSQYNISMLEGKNFQTTSFDIKGMSCKACESEVNNELYKVTGVIDAKTFYAKGTAIVKYDPSKATIKQLKNAIAQTGYKVVNSKLSNK